MGTHEFIEQNKERILNIDGNADDGNITVEGDGGYLEFYYFENGVMVKAKTKRVKRR